MLQSHSYSPPKLPLSIPYRRQSRSRPLLPSPTLVMASDDKTPLNDSEGKPDYSSIFGEKKEEFAKQTVFGEVCLSKLRRFTSPCA